MYETIRTELTNGVLTIFLNRPERLNAYTHQMSAELIEAYQKADDNDDVRVIVVTGAGKAFCAGMDLSEGDKSFASDDVDFRDSGGQVSLQVYQLKKPIIAAINGSAVGIGLTMTLPMDIRIVTPDAKISFAFSRRGIGPEAASGWFLPRIAGVGKALEWMYTGRFIPSQEAYEHGLVQYVEEDPLTKAYEIATDIAMNTAATSTSFIRPLLWNMLGEDDPYASHLVESKFLAWAGNHADAKEGVQSFLEKRPAKFPLKSNDGPKLFQKSEVAQ